MVDNKYYSVFLSLLVAFVLNSQSRLKFEKILLKSKFFLNANTNFVLSLSLNIQSYKKIIIIKYL